MDCVVYHVPGNCPGSDNGLVVTTEKVLVLIYLGVNNHDADNSLSNSSAQCVCVCVHHLCIYDRYHLSINHLIYIYQ